MAIYQVIEKNIDVYDLHSENNSSRFIDADFFVIKRESSDPNKLIHLYTLTNNNSGTEINRTDKKLISIKYTISRYPNESNYGQSICEINVQVGKSNPLQNFENGIYLFNLNEGLLMKNIMLDFQHKQNNHLRLVEYSWGPGRVDTIRRVVIKTLIQNRYVVLTALVTTTILH